MIAEMPALPNKNKPVPMMQECIWDKNPEETNKLFFEEEQRLLK